jgi:hypothetical protein
MSKNKINQTHKHTHSKRLIHTVASGSRRRGLLMIIICRTVKTLVRAHTYALAGLGGGDAPGRRPATAAARRQAWRLF